MASVWGTTQKFRQEFIIPDKKVLRWFPGHMAGGVKKIQTKLKSVDCILEVHDARIPISGRNPNFKHNFLGVKPHVLVLNKADLGDANNTPEILRYLEIKENISDVVFTDCKNQKSSVGLKNLVPKVLAAISNSNRHNRISNREFGVLIIGVPNVGKSSLINALRAKYLHRAGHAPVGPKPGVTLSVQNRIRISQDPPVFIYDTPGILTPSLPNTDAGMKLALCAAIKDSLIGPVVIADYLLYWCNKHHWNNEPKELPIIKKYRNIINETSTAMPYSLKEVPDITNQCGRFDSTDVREAASLAYLDFFGIADPCDDIGKVLTDFAIKRNLYVRLKSFEGAACAIVNKPDINRAATMFVEAFRKGQLGSVTLDIDVLS